jgi:hypothetical protein
VVGHDVVAIGELLFTDPANAVLGNDLPVEELAHFPVRAQFAERLRAALTEGEWRRMIRLPNGRLVALFIDEATLRECP